MVGHRPTHLTARHWPATDGLRDIYAPAPLAPRSSRYNVEINVGPQNEQHHEAPIRITLLTLLMLQPGRRSFCCQAMTPTSDPVEGWAGLRPHLRHVPSALDGSIIIMSAVRTVVGTSTTCSATPGDGSWTGASPSTENHPTAWRWTPGITCAGPMRPGPRVAHGAVLMDGPSINPLIPEAEGLRPPLRHRPHLSQQPNTYDHQQPASRNTD